MGFRQAAVIAPVCFFLGVLFICFTVDHRILWGQLTEQVKADGYQFYATFYTSPPAIKALLHGMIGVGILALVAKLYKWDDSAMFFDGTSIGAYIFAIAVYVAVIIPALKTITEPHPELDNPVDKLEAMRVLSAGNVIIALCLGAILILQAGQAYARNLDAKEKERILKDEKEKEALGKHE